MCITLNLLKFVPFQIFPKWRKQNGHSLSSVIQGEVLGEKIWVPAGPFASLGSPGCLLKNHVELGQKFVATGLSNCSCMYSSPSTLSLPWEKMEREEIHKNVFLRSYFLLSLTSLFCACWNLVTLRCSKVTSLKRRDENLHKPEANAICQICQFIIEGVASQLFPLV